MQHRGMQHGINCLQFAHILKMIKFDILPRLLLRSSRVDFWSLRGRSWLWYVAVAVSLAACLLPETCGVSAGIKYIKERYKKKTCRKHKIPCLLWKSNGLSVSLIFFLDVSEMKDENGSLWTVTKFNTSLKMSTYLTAFVICDFDYVTRTVRGNEVNIRLHNTLQQLTTEVGSVVHHVLYRQYHRN